MFRPNSFEAVERLYESIRPVVSKNHTIGDDIRPISSRRKKHERIEKLTNNCYALMEGYGRGDAVFGFGGEESPTVDETQELSAIVWERHPDRLDKFGNPVETIKLRHGTVGSIPMRRYKFLHKWLPESLPLRTEGGKQWIGGQFFPQTKYVGGTWYTYLKSTPRGYDIIEHYGFTDEDDGKFLLFERSYDAWADHQFVYVGTEFKPPKVTSSVDKDLKAELKPHYEKLWEFACAMAPLLPTGEWQFRRDMAVKRGDSGLTIGYGGYDHEKIIDAIRSENVELRTALITDFLADGGRFMKTMRTKEDLKAARTAFNYWINKACGLVTKTKTEQ